MSAPTTPACPLGLSADDLSAWRDHALPATAAERISAHASGCLACQRIIAAHEALAAAAQTEEAPAPDPRAWPQLQARIAAAQHGRAPASPALSRARRPAVWGGLGAVAAVLLLSALFIHLFAQQALVRGGSSHTATATVLATPQPIASVAPTTPIAGPQLDWQTHMAPESVIPPPGNQTYTNGFAFSPTDAQTAYICATTNALNAPITIWATHDGARTWTHVSDIPTTAEVADCGVVVDAANPQRLNVTISEYGVHSYLSDDGGKTWRALGDDVQLVGLETRSNVSVALAYPWDFANPVTSATPSRNRRLSVSYDDWRTWQPIDGALAAQGLIVEKVWRRPADGALLVEAASRSAPATPSATNGPDTYANYTYSLWQSVNIGNHWSAVPTPANLAGATAFVVAQPQGNNPWRICGLKQTGISTNATQNELIGCTFDGGHTWTSTPLPALKQSCGNGCLQQQIMAAWNTALLSDGSLISMFYAGSTDPKAMQTQDMYHIFRLAPGSSQWQDLGSQPGGMLVMLGAPASGTLVSYSGGGSMDGLGGSLVGHLGGDIPNRGALAIAILP